MLLSSSKRAFSSTSAVTCLPSSAARCSAFTSGDSPPVRYKVCLIASTRGSSAACDKKSITASKDS